MIIGMLHKGEDRWKVLIHPFSGTASHFSVVDAQVCEGLWWTWAVVGNEHPPRGNTGRIQAEERHNALTLNFLLKILLETVEYGRVGCETERPMACICQRGEDECLVQGLGRQDTVAFHVFQSTCGGYSCFFYMSL